MSAHEGLHEAADKLSSLTVNLHRALVSMMEELEAIDWYQQRVDATDDEELASVLAHHRDEEVEHFVMLLEYVRRHNPVMDECLRAYLFKDGDLRALEAEKTGSDGPFLEREGAAAPAASSSPAPMTVGSLRKK